MYSADLFQGDIDVHIWEYARAMSICSSQGKAKVSLLVLADDQATPGLWNRRHCKEVHQQSGVC